MLPYSIYNIDICKEVPEAWKYIKVLYFIFLSYSLTMVFSAIYIQYLQNRNIEKSEETNKEIEGLHLYIGNIERTEEPIYITEKGLYQNILITGTIGTGKTSSSMYPFTKQLIEYEANCIDKKIGMLILDVKGNFYKQVKIYAKEAGRLEDLIIIDIEGSANYNPLNKPNLNPMVLANRLKTILTLFSPNTTENFWLDKVEQILGECIKLCRLYNNGYVNFVELHKLINSEGYYKEKLGILREIFQSGKMDYKDVYNLSSAINFFENEFTKLDDRTLAILKSEITRITNTFITDFNILKTFCPEKDEITFDGFKEVIEKGKIVVLNMNIAEYKNLAKIIAAYLKLDFQSEILNQLSNSERPPKTTAFICDEFHEYVTSTDSEFFAQSRESKSINIVATQSYTSLLNTLHQEASVKVIVQNLINKIWYRTDDSFTVEDIQKQIGKEDKSKTSRTISENAQETSYNYFTNSLSSKKSNLSESINTYVQSDFIYDTKFFTQELQTFSCLAFLSDGNKILKPQKLQMIPHFLINQKSQMDQKGEKDKKSGKNKYKII